MISKIKWLGSELPLIFNFRIKEDNSRLQNELVSTKAHSLDIESFAKEQLEGKNVESILEQIKQKDSDERLKIEEKVWETRLQDASAKIEELEKENLDQREELTSQLEQELVFTISPSDLPNSQIFKNRRFLEFVNFRNSSICDYID